MTTPDLTRRAFGCAALFGIAGPLLVACGSGGDDGNGDGGAAEPQQDGGGTKSDSPAPGGSAGGGLIAVADVPVGGGVVLTGQAIVIVQPTKGEFKGYSSVCPHQQNPVGEVEDGVITCNFHGSQFSADDGSVVTGPATSPLPEIAVEVKDGQVLRA